jgi:hypothetical protein
MNNNPLINRSNIKYNPDVLSKFQSNKNIRSQGYVIPHSDKPQKVTVISNDGDMRKKMQTFTQTRNEQDQQIQRIFSNENRYKNKQIFDERQAEIVKVTSIMSNESSGKQAYEMKNESNQYNQYKKTNTPNLIDQIKDFIISYE